MSKDASVIMSPRKKRGIIKRAHDSTNLRDGNAIGWTSCN
jgi:hypothetical protein